MGYSSFARYYDALTSNVDYGRCAEFLDAIMQEHKPGCKLIADLACGTGSISVLLSRAGYDVIGVDSSAEMLMQARQKECPGILWLCQDIRRLDLYGTIDAAVCVLDSVNHLTSPGALQKAFERVSLFLERDGLFIFDANTPYKHESVLASNAYIYETDDIFCAWRNSDEGHGMTEITLDFFERSDGAYRRETECFRERAYSQSEIISMLNTAGLDVIGLYDDYTESPPCAKTERIVYLARKKGQDHV